MQSLLVEQTPADCAICRVTTPFATIACLPLPQLLQLITANDTPLPTAAAGTHGHPDTAAVSGFLHDKRGVAGIDIHGPCGTTDHQLEWLTMALALIASLLPQPHFKCLVLSTPLSEDIHDGSALSTKLVLDPSLRDKWSLQCGPTSSIFYGDSVNARRWIAIGLRNTTGTER